MVYSASEHFTVSPKIGVLMGGGEQGLTSQSLFKTPIQWYLSYFSRMDKRIRTAQLETCNDVTNIIQNGSQFNFRQTLTGCHLDSGCVGLHLLSVFRVLLVKLYNWEPKLWKFNKKPLCVFKGVPVLFNDLFIFTASLNGTDK